MANNPKTVSVVQNRITAMQAGFTKDFTAKQSLAVDGNTMLQPAIMSMLATVLSLITNAETARTALAAAVAAKKAGMAQVLKDLDNLEAALKAAFGSGAAQLQDFGIKPPKARKALTAEEKALSVAAAKGTKKVRGIIGKSQRAAITTQGKPGLVLVSPDGSLVPGALTGPTPPGSGTPVAVTVTPAPASSSAGGSTSASAAPGSTAVVTPPGGSTPTSGQ